MKKRFVSIIIGLMIILTVTSIAKPEWFSKLQLSPQVDTPLPNGITVYAYGGNGLVSKQKGNEVSYYHNDNLGSSAITTKSNGDIAYSTDYYPFGKAIHEDGNEKYKYNGKELDNTGLYYYGARYYDASLGRFISVDPVSGNIYNGQRLNRYSYTLNNPLKYVDPSGGAEVSPRISRQLYYDSDIVYASVSKGYYFSDFDGYNLDGHYFSGNEFKATLGSFLDDRHCRSICFSTPLSVLGGGSAPEPVSNSAYLRRTLGRYETYAQDLFERSKEIMSDPEWYKNEDLQDAHQRLVMLYDRTLTDADIEGLYSRGLDPFGMANGYFTAYYQDLAGKEPSNSDFSSNVEQYLNYVEEYPEAYGLFGGGKWPVEHYTEDGFTKIPPPDGDLFGGETIFGGGDGF